MKKTSKHKTSKRKAISKKPAAKVKVEKPIGKVVHYFRKIKVAVVKFKRIVAKGTRVQFKGATTDFGQSLDSMQFNHASIARAPKNKQIGLKVTKRVREGDKIFAE